MDQSRKLPIYEGIKRTAQQASSRQYELAGRCMPASVVSVSGSIVTVKFEVQSEFTIPHLTVPVFGAEYIRLPIQPGCKGFVVSSDYYLGAMSGLGPGVATMRLTGNLSNLVFYPIGNKNWASVDGNKLVLYGVDGVTITDKQGGTSSVTVTSDSVSMKTSNASVVCSKSGVDITGTLTINGQAYMSHTHTNGNNGSPTGGVIG